MPLNGNSSGHQPRRWWVTALAIVAAVIVLAAFITRRDDAIPVRTATVEKGNIRSLISTNGKIEPVSNFEAHAPISTTVQRLLVKEGDFVKKGQLLVVLDAPVRTVPVATVVVAPFIAWNDHTAPTYGGCDQ